MDVLFFPGNLSSGTVLSVKGREREGGREGGGSLSRYAVCVHGFSLLCPLSLLLPKVFHPAALQRK